MSELSNTAKELLIRLKRASDLSPIGQALVIGNKRGESRVIPATG